MSTGRKAPAPLSTVSLALRAGVVLLFLLLFLWMVKGSPVSSPAAKSQEEEPVQETPAAPEEPVLDTATLTFTGDFVGHLHVVNSVYDSATDSYDFTTIFQYAGTWMEDTDYLIGNLETTLSGGTYSGSPNFNSPDDLAVSLHQLGYDLLTTANNHCLDQGFSGLSRTLDVLDENGIAHVGTYRSQEEFDENQGVLVQQVGNLSVAFLDYTYGVNYSTVENDFSVNRFNLNTGNETQVTLDTERLDADMEYARSLNTDLIIVLMHWGIEYETTENADQDMVADYLIARGADAVLGGHSHVPQPLDYRSVTGIDGSERTGFVCYSLGNLVSNQSDPVYTQYTAALNLTLTKDNSTGECSVTDATYTPLYLLNRGDDATPQYLLLDTRAAIADYEGSRTNPYITEDVYTQLQSSLTDLSTFFGSRWAYTDSDTDLTAQDASAQDSQPVPTSSTPSEEN
jgi:poly-gamma-glutamate synthesis protein (capsule biosynthesis protein)